MLVFLTRKEIDKKKYSDFRILLPSEYIDASKFNQDKIFPMEQLIPPTEIMQAYLNKDIDKKIFKKKYFKYLQKDEYRITLSYIIYDIVKNNRDYAMTCSDEEYDYGYMSYLAEFIHKLYGLNVLTHKAYKELELDDEKVILHMNSVPEEVFAFVLEDVREGYNETKKKDKKKKKKDKDKKKGKGKKKKNKNKNKYFDENKLKNYGYGEKTDDNDGSEKPKEVRKIFKRID